MPDPTSEERTERLERAIGQLGANLHSTHGSRLWRGAPDLLALVEEHLGEKFDPNAPTRG